MPTAEKRKLLFFTMNYYWMDQPSFAQSGNSISLLRTHHDLKRNEYHCKITYKTFLIDLSKSLDDIFSAFDAKAARPKIRKALRSGVTVKVAESVEEKQRFFDFYQEFAQTPGRKNKILVVQQDELEKLHILYAVSSEGEYLGGIGLLPSSDGRYLLDKYCATLHKLCEQELLIWDSIRYAKERGYSYFDLSWMLPTEDRSNKQYNLYQFKKKFGGELVEFYSYIKIRGALKVLGVGFRLVLRYLFNDDINKCTLFLKKIRVFR
jgi:hypothetical protein